MNEETEKNLSLLKRKMMNEIKPILFTGAGFSYTAKNGKGNNLPLGYELKSLILTKLLSYDENDKDYTELISHRLDEVYGFAKDAIGLRVDGFLIDLFSKCIPLEHHRTIINYPWQKIYTVNIDDLIEHIVPENDLLVHNSINLVIPSAKNQIEYYKLHGCVNNKDGGFVFSRDDYQNKIFGKKDYRYAKLIEDLQTQDFVFIGTSGDEDDISAYLMDYGFDSTSKQGNIFVINPYPDIIQATKIRKSGARLIEMTCQDFATWINDSLAIQPKGTTSPTSQRFFRNYLNVNKYVEAHKKEEITTTRFYLGDYPTWLDILNDYDFNTPSSNESISRISQLIESSNDNIIFSLLSKAIGGKSVHLKRIGIELYKMGYDVYEFVGSEFNIGDFIHGSRHSVNDTVVLLVDDASGNYASIGRLLDKYPSSKRVVVVTTSRPYFHYKKYYDIRHFPTYSHLDIDKNFDSLSYYEIIGKSAVNTLKRKGLLGNLKKMPTDEERVKFFIKNRDICDALWKIFHGSNLKNRLLRSYNKIEDINSKEDASGIGRLVKDVMLALAFFNRQEIRYLPDTLLFNWLGKDKNIIQKRIDDITKRVNDGISLRTDILTKEIIRKSNEDDKLNVIFTILMHISPYIHGNKDSIWHQIQSRLMNVTFLHKSLRIDGYKIKGLFNDLLSYYGDDNNYFLQMGRAEQNLGQYDLALNHFQQAEAISPNYYNVLNAIARNYILQSYKDVKIDKDTAEEYYREGNFRMMRLIEEKEQYQVRAYSIHSLAVESVNYWGKWNIIPDKNEVVAIIEKLKEALDDFPEDERIEYACHQIMSFITRNNLNNWIPRDNNLRLSLFKTLQKDYTNPSFEEDDILD